MFLHGSTWNRKEACGHSWVFSVCASWPVLIQVPFLSQALPYVALLIAMLFFIYAVIGMQVSSSHLTLRGPFTG